MVKLPYLPPLPHSAHTTSGFARGVRHFWKSCTKFEITVIFFVVSWFRVGFRDFSFGFVISVLILWLPMTGFCSHNKLTSKHYCLWLLNAITKTDDQSLWVSFRRVVRRQRKLLKSAVLWSQGLRRYTMLTAKMWPDFGKSVLMSHFTTQIFITKMRNGIFQSTWKWLQCVVPTLNYQKIIGNTPKSSVILLLWSQ